MEQPKFKIDQLVKFKNDHDRMTGQVLAYSYHSANVTDNHSGWVYTISSKYYDAELHDMVEGHKICREEELVDMTGYTGSTEPEKPDHVVNVSDQVNAEQGNQAEAAQPQA